MRLRTFHTGLVSTDYPRYPTAPYQGKGWSVKFSRVSGTFPGRVFQVSNGRRYAGKEITISAPNRRTAERAVNLIHGAMRLLDGSNSFSHLPPGENPAVYPNDDCGDLCEFLNDQYRSTLHMPIGCLIAAKASLRRQLVYALAKLRLSYEIFSIPGMALDPSQGPNIPKSHLPEEHVRFAYAIVLANACMEELGLRVPAHQNKQSWINGAWNPEVKNEFEQNLQNSNIDLSDPFYRNIRGGKTNLEGKRPPRIIEKAPWNRYNVRDGAMEIVDAMVAVGTAVADCPPHRSVRAELPHTALA